MDMLLYTLGEICIVLLFIIVIIYTSISIKSCIKTKVPPEGEQLKEYK